MTTNWTSIGILTVSASIGILQAMRNNPNQALAMHLHGIIHFLAKQKAKGTHIPLSTTALMKWHKESASDLMRHGLRHLSPLERYHIEGPVGSKF